MPSRIDHPVTGPLSQNAVVQELIQHFLQRVIDFLCRAFDRLARHNTQQVSSAEEQFSDTRADVVHVSDESVVLVIGGR